MQPHVIYVMKYIVKENAVTHAIHACVTYVLNVRYWNMNPYLTNIHAQDVLINKNKKK